MPTQRPAGERNLEQEETLDPGDWEEFRRLGHRMLDDTIDYLATRREQPVWQAMPDGARVIP
jgi:aromatic-L-amino-acid decarboxylase